MVIEACLIILAISSVLLVVSLIRGLVEMERTLHSLQKDAKSITVDLSRLVHHLEELARNDLPHLSQQTSHLINNLINVSSTIAEKRPESLSPAVHWIASGLSLFKTIKEFVTHEKRTG